LKIQKQNSFKMKNSLEKYKKKRKFKQTVEPKGKIKKSSKNRFVIQEHWARKHHFDFRLEMSASRDNKEIVLKSWAVPKGIPKKKGVKRLAIQTEDHPVDYISFEGEIPQGSYGAGKVEIFDKGVYDLNKRGKDEILFELKGNKIKGNYALIKFKGQRDQWLLFKTKN